MEHIYALMYISRYFYWLLTKFRFPRHTSIQVFNNVVNVNPSTGSRDDICGQTIERTDEQTEKAGRAEELNDEDNWRFWWLQERAKHVYKNPK
jgi:hypothetical protein